MVRLGHKRSLSRKTAFDARANLLHLNVERFASSARTVERFP
jgi:hypothetical protein